MEKVSPAAFSLFTKKFSLKKKQKNFYFFNLFFKEQEKIGSFLEVQLC